MWYSVEIRPKAGFISDLSADILWGHLIWGLVYLGRDSLLPEIFSNPERLICSSIFIKNSQTDETYVPALQLPITQEGSKRKRLKKVAYIPLSLLKGIADNFHIDLYWERLQEYSSSKLDSFFISFKAFHNTISRLTGTVLEEGGFFAKQEMYLATGYSFVFFINWEYDYDLLVELLGLVFNLGYGADKNTGKGQFLFDGSGGVGQLEEDFFGNKDKANAVVLFSPSSVSDSTFILDTSFYKTKTKIGRLGGDYANIFPYFKRPVVLLREGSVMRIKEKKSFYGNLIQGVHEDEKIVHYGVGVPFWINMGD